ncbi:UDP-2,4-diacetamido-2,4,6-trideoxy-beta-L-altropyranose hydrolase [Pedobacter heparinus]|uniref:Spore coat polysaccharide biosynthesis protein predicted glycosyltransferase n=1 Tax=Pedobacter heparinus (strain ATCC 13125 / DSM 2366 / CIP 104194 / JCM 7457 / NBRC 12017 / NCIMB 9290 / NRRL B-14731 / HIM 762-3) TaxID=485917 RepID=C6XVR0_PEDHD|nr:UDP-2,4-diacetamido-2,4,6-trideoxy-beta-L-altropyranose hydrolase [Pedobacter heparinus]ACU06135.1 Spore coat polysaccharide biosynthesis protein predicted glycosyltransferase [Pedobacter heparinus DSM 2366]
MHKPRILFRADGNNKIGLGHIMRCIALSEMLSPNFNCVFLISKPSLELQSIIRTFGDLIELKSNTKIDELFEITPLLLSTDIVVTDGYDFNNVYLKYIKCRVHKLVVIDDLAKGEFIADLVINHGGEYIKDKYKTESYTRLLIGFDYLIVRKAFIQALTKNRVIDEIETVFICMGGADPFSVTTKVIKACIKSGFVKNIIVVIGNAYVNTNDLINLIENENEGINIKLERNLSAELMVDMISACQLSICPASSISLEVCCVKSGLLTGTVIDNQFAIHEQLIRKGCAMSIGDFNKATIEDIITALNEVNSVERINELIRCQKLATMRVHNEELLKEFMKLSL